MKILKTIFRFILWPLHRGRLFIIVFLISLVSFGQKVFIGKSTLEVKDYWMEKTQPKFVHTEEYEDGTIAEIWVMKGDIGNPDFSALFDEKGKCVEQTVYTSAENLKGYMSTWKEKGFIFNKQTNKWTKPGMEIEVQGVGDQSFVQVTHRKT